MQPQIAQIKMDKKMIKVAILTLSDKTVKGLRKDESGPLIHEMVKALPAEVVRYEVLPDELELIKKKLIEYCDKLKVDIVFTTGGTGFSHRDVTPEATREVIEKEVPGIPEAMRFEGFKKTKRAMLSRGIAGLRKSTLIINLPGNTRGVKESLEVILDTLEHGLEMIWGREH